LDLFVFVIYLVCLGLYFFFLFTFNAYKKKEKVPKRKKNQLVFQNSSSSLWFIEPLFAKQTLTSLSLYAHKAHNRNEVAGVGIELLNFRSKFLGLVPENLCTKIHTNSHW